MIRRFLPAHTVACSKQRDVVLKFLKHHGILDPVTTEVSTAYVLQCPIGCSPLLVMVLSQEGTFVTEESNSNDRVYKLNNNHLPTKETTLVQVRYAEKVAGSLMQLAHPQCILFWKGADVRSIDTADSFHVFNMQKIPGIREAVVYSPIEDMASLLAVPRSLFLIGKCPSDQVCIPILPATTAPLMAVSSTPKNHQDNLFLMERHPKKLPDVYYLHPYGSSLKHATLAVVPDTKTSEMCRK